MSTVSLRIRMRGDSERRPEMVDHALSRGLADDEPQGQLPQRQVRAPVRGHQQQTVLQGQSCAPAIRSVHEVHLQPAQYRCVGCLASGPPERGAPHIAIRSTPQGLAPGSQADLRLRKPQIIDESAEHGIGCGAVTGRARERRLLHLGGVAQKLQDHVPQLRTVRSRLLRIERPGARSRHQYLAEQ